MGLTSIILLSFILVLPLIHLTNRPIDSINSNDCTANQRKFLFRVDRGNFIHISKENKINPNYINEDKFYLSVRNKKFLKVFKNHMPCTLIETINLLNPQEYEDVSNFLIFEDYNDLNYDGYGVACVSILSTFPNGIINSRMVNIMKVESVEFYESLEQVNVKYK